MTAAVRVVLAHGAPVDLAPDTLAVALADGWRWTHPAELRGRAVLLRRQHAPQGEHDTRPRAILRGAPVPGSTNPAALVRHEPVMLAGGVNQPPRHELVRVLAELVPGTLALVSVPGAFDSWVLGGVDAPGGGAWGVWSAAPKGVARAEHGRHVLAPHGRNPTPPPGVRVWGGVWYPPGWADGATYVLHPPLLVDPDGVPGPWGLVWHRPRRDPPGLVWHTDTPDTLAVDAWPPAPGAPAPPPG